MLWMITLERIAEDAGGGGGASSSPEVNTKEQDKGSTGPVILFFYCRTACKSYFGMDHLSQAALLARKNSPSILTMCCIWRKLKTGVKVVISFERTGTYSGVPKLDQCIDCHEEIQGDKSG